MRLGFTNALDAFNRIADRFLTLLLWAVFLFAGGFLAGIILGLLPPPL